MDHTTLKKNVNVGVAGLVALAMVVAACAGSSGSDGLVRAPMLPAGSAGGPDADAGDAATPRDSGVDARALPPEPRPPDRSGCKRVVSCFLPSTDPPPWPLPAPFEHCMTTLAGHRSAKLSVKETTAARAKTPGTCCYVDFDCEGGRKHGVIRMP